MTLEDDTDSALDRRGRSWTSSVSSLPRKSTTGCLDGVNRVYASVVSRDKVFTAVAGRFEPLLERGLVAALQEDHRVCLLEQSVPDGALASVVLRHAPRVVILDETVSFELLIALKRARPAPALLVLVESPSTVVGTTLLACGVACSARNGSASDILTSVAHSARGEPVFVAANGSRTIRVRLEPAPSLGKRESEVLSALISGGTYAEIGAALSMAPETARRHTANICRKFGVKSRLELVGSLAQTTPWAGSIDMRASWR